MKLYEIASQYRNIEAMIDAADGEITPEIEATFAEIDDAFAVKAEAIGFLIRERAAEYEAISHEADLLRERARAKEREGDRLRAFLLRNLKVAGKSKLKTVFFSFWQAKASRPSIDWKGQGSPPPEFCRTQVVLDGRKAQEVYESSGSLPEGFEVSRSEYLGMR